MQSLPRLMMSALALSAATLAAPAQAIGRLVDVDVIDRDTGAQLPVYQHRGEWWIAGRPGARYAIQVRNAAPGRVLGVMAVDGVNVISGDTASWEQTGTTIKQAGSQAAFRAVDFDAVVNTARAAHTAGARRLGIVSAMGADAASRVFYNRVKGEMEQAVRAVGVDTTVFARPSLLEGDRSTLQQPPRAGERWLHVVMRALRPVTPANLRAIEARDVALSLMDAARTQGPGAHVLLSGALQRR